MGDGATVLVELVGAEEEDAKEKGAGGLNRRFQMVPGRALAFESLRLNSLS